MDCQEWQEGNIASGHQQFQQILAKVERVSESLNVPRTSGSHDRGDRKYEVSIACVISVLPPPFSTLQW